jgi:hypothetical protein
MGAQAQGTVRPGLGVACSRQKQAETEQAHGVRHRRPRQPSD